MSLTRRAMLAGAASGLAGCGFHPVYGPLAKGGRTVRPELAAIYVNIMPERPGQLLREALEARLEGSGASGGKLYQLYGGMGLAIEAFGVQQDTSTTRNRITGTATWSLSTLEATPKPMTSGTTRILDGYDVNNEQFFAADLEQNAAIRRIAETAADNIVLDLALFFRKRAGAT